MALSETLKSINKKFGNNVIMPVSKKENMKVESVPTACPSLNEIFGVGGVPLGRIMDLYGEESQGKSTLAMYIVAEFQKAGKVTAWIDTEQCFTSDYATSIGIDIAKLFLVQPTTGEEAMDILKELVDSGDFGLVVIDSTANITPAREMEGKMGDSHIALQARLIGKALRAITAPAAKNKTTVLFISQLRSNIGMFAGPSQVATGGKAIRFYSSVRMRVKTASKIKGKDNEIIGNRLRIKAEKNKVAKPFRETEIDVYFDKGVDVIADIFDIAVKKEVITKSGNTYTLGDFKLGVGRDNAKEALSVDEKLFDKVKNELWKPLKTENTENVTGKKSEVKSTK